MNGRVDTNFRFTKTEIELFYPTIRDEQVMTLTVVVQSLEQDPGYLDHPDCTYSEPVKAFFRKFMSSGDAPPDLFEGEDDLLVIDKQVQAVINDLERFSKTLGNADHSEKLQYFKTKTVLLEKLVTMKERVLNLKEINEFRSTLLSFMDELCTKDQITEMMRRLDGILGIKTDDL